MSIKGITRRWVAGALWISMGILASITMLFMFLLRGYFYKNMETKISGHAIEVSNVFSLHKYPENEMFDTFAISYVEGIRDMDDLQVVIYDKRDELVICSDGPWNSNYSFFKNGINNKEYDGAPKVWAEFLPSGEHVMTTTKNLFNHEHEYVGAIKYIVPLKKTDSLFFSSFIAFLIFSIMVILFTVIVGICFIKSIVHPIVEISNIAKLIAHGNFTIKIEEKYNDEIGELCSAINYMAEELGTAEKIKNDFISSVSHEIRTPLTAIKGWAETLRCEDEIDKSVTEKGLDIIVHETERLSTIVEELLDFSRLQNGRMVVSMDKLDILAELGEAVYIFKERAVSENKALIYNEPKMLPPIMGDKNKLRQVFINIIDNALKYTSEGGGISVGVGEKNDKICVSITDNGCGISEQHLPHVTEKFYKADSSQRGSGIGLAIVSELIEMHNGSLEIISEEGFGTTVNVLLPMIKGDLADMDLEGK